MKTDSNKINKKNKFFQRKQNIYRKMLGFIPEAIILLSGGFVKEIRKDGKTEYRSTKINEGDAFGVLWGEARVLAVTELATYFPQTTIIVASNPGVREELEKLSVPQNRIILEEVSTNTLSQIEMAMKVVYKKKIKKVILITNEYHIPRVQALYENKIKHSDTRIQFIAAEIVLRYKDKKFIKIIKQMKESPAYQKRLKSEARGLKMIKDGTYGKINTPNIDKLERTT